MKDMCGCQGKGKYSSWKQCCVQCPTQPRTVHVELCTVYCATVVQCKAHKNICVVSAGPGMWMDFQVSLSCMPPYHEDQGCHLRLWHPRRIALVLFIPQQHSNFSKCQKIPKRRREILQCMCLCGADSLLSLGFWTFQQAQFSRWWVASEGEMQLSIHLCIFSWIYHISFMQHFMCDSEQSQLRLLQPISWVDG